MIRVTTESTTTITLTVTPDEAARIMADFDQRREPSIPGKALYSALMKARGADPIAEAFARRSTPDPATCELPGRETSETTETGSAA